ncbi:MAG: hypothetical protein ACOCU6_00180 [Nanoarchaeota archaeon]
MNKKGQHVLDLTTLIAGVIFIALAITLFSLFADALEGNQQEKVMVSQAQLQSEQFVRTFSMTPVMYGDKEISVGELAQKYYDLYIQDEIGNCNDCQKKMEAIKIVIEEKANQVKPLFQGSSEELSMTLMKEKSQEGTKGTVSFEIADDIANKCELKNGVSKLCYTYLNRPAAIYLPVITSQPTSRYDNYVIAIGFITKWLDSKEPYKYDSEDAKTLD